MSVVLGVERLDARAFDLRASRQVFAFKIGVDPRALRVGTTVASRNQQAALLGWLVRKYPIRWTAWSRSALRPAAGSEQSTQPRATRC